MSSPKPFLKSALLPVLAFIVMAGAYAAVFYIFKAQSLKDFADVISKVPSIRLFGSGTVGTVMAYFPTYGALAGLVFGLLNLILAYILLGLFAIVRLTKLAFGVTLSLLLSLVPFAFLGWGLVYSSNTNTALAAGIVYFVGRPLWYASLITLGFAFVLFLLSFKYGQPKSQA
ncbi:hypothetical protein HZC53_02295 [Candidatus Uhrbacteria bacterium]|nr:hypothetical protein [Candidatus Uhrbacteria bacterium]